MFDRKRKETRMEITRTPDYEQTTQWNVFINGVAWSG